MGRRKISAARRDFTSEIDRLRRLDDINQERYFPGPGRPSAERLSKSQISLLSESILTRAFSKYEKYVEECFILYAQGKKSQSGTKVGSYLSPKSSEHARELVKSGMTFLEWNAPDKIIDRAKTYLHVDSPPFLAASTHRVRLERIRKVRNAIAHASKEAELRFSAVVRQELGSSPLKAVTPGEFLIMTDPNSSPTQHFLKSYLQVLDEVTEIMAA